MTRRSTRPWWLATALALGALAAACGGGAAPTSTTAGGGGSRSSSQTPAGTASPATATSGSRARSTGPTARPTPGADAPDHRPERGRQRGPQPDQRRGGQLLRVAVGRLRRGPLHGRDRDLGGGPRHDGPRDGQRLQLLPRRAEPYPGELTGAPA